MKHNKEKISSVLVILLFAFLAAGSADTTEDNSPSTTSESSTEQKTEEDPKEITYMPVTANELYAEYEKNEIAANQKFKDNYLEISGTVESIDSTIGDTPVVLLKCGGDYSFTNVHCQFKNLDEAATIVKGTNVTVHGKSAGEIMGSPNIRDCQLKK